MELCVFVLIIFQPVIGNQIKLAVPTEVHSIPRERIEFINWVKDTSSKSKNMLVNLNNLRNGRLSIDKSEKYYGYLLIEPTERSDSGPYTCQVRDLDLKMWNVTYQLDVYYMDPPYLTGPFTIKNNTNATFHCEWTDINPNKVPNITWNFDGEELNISNGYIMKKKETRGTLVIMNPSEKYFGTYTCNITVDINNDTMRQKSNIVELEPWPSICKSVIPTVMPEKNPRHEILDVGHVVSTAVAFTIGSLLAFFVTCKIYIKQRQKIHLCYQKEISRLQRIQSDLWEYYSEMND